MTTLDLGIDVDVLGQLAELPEQILAAVDTARQALADADSSDDGNAVGALLAGLGSLPDQLANLPDLDAALGGLAGLGDLLPAGLPASAGGALDALGAVTGFIGPLAALIDNDPADLIAKAVDQLAGVTGTIETQTGTAAVTGELHQFLALLGSLDGWAQRPPPVAEVAGLVAKAFIGADLDIIAEPAAALGRALAGLDAVLPEGPDVERWRTGLGGLEATWTGFEARLTGAIDWRSLEVDLQAAGLVQADLIAARDRLLAGAVAALGRIDLGGLATAAVALRSIPEIPEVRLTPILDGIVAALRSLRDGLEHWELSADDVRRIVRGLMQRLRDAVEHSALGEMRRWLLDLEQRVLAFIDGLPLRTIADEITGTLDGIAAAIDGVDLAGLLAPITQFGDTIRTAIVGLGGDAVRTTIGQVWDAVESALTQAADILGQLRDTLDGVTGPLTEFSSRVGPAVTAITDLITQVRVVVDAFDLAQPAAAVIDILHRARDIVAAIDVSLLPAAAVQLVGEAAGALADIDIAGAISEPITEVLDAIDPGPILQTAVEALGEVSAQLAAVDPSQLIATIDAPVGEVLQGLAALDPTQLRTLIDEAIAPVRDAIGTLDATGVLAPATQAFADVMARLDGLLDPAPIFEPLQAAYQPVIDIVQALDPRKLLDLVSPHVEGVTGSIGGATSGTIGPGAMTGGGAGFTALPSTVDASDDLFGFRPGDLLVPLIDLHHRLVSAIEGLATDLLDQAAAVVQEAFGGRLASLRPDSVLARIDATFARVEGELGAIATTTAVSGAAFAYQRVTARIAIAAPGANGDDAVVSARISASLPALDPLRLVADSGQAAALAAGAALANTRADLTALRSAYAVGAARLERLLPGFLADPAGGVLDGGGLLGVLRDLDPAPIRVEVNQLFDEAGQFLAGLDEVLAAALEEMAATASELLDMVNPTGLLDLVGRIHAGVVAQVEAIAPATLAEHVRLIFGAVRRQLEALDPAQLAEQVDAVRNGLLETLDELLDGLLPDPAPLHALQQQLAELRPSRLLAPVTEALAPISQLAGTLDADALVQPLSDGIDRIKEQLPDIIAQLEAAFDEVLRAFPEGGVSGVSVSASASGSIG